VIEESPEALAALRDRTLRYPPARYPVQHATAQFHLGVALTEAGRYEDAARALAEAVRLFPADQMPGEQAAAANALGAAWRARGRLDEAAAAFVQAREGFERAGRAPEVAAALHNLGLVEVQRGRPQVAARRLAEALKKFEACGSAAGAAGAAAAARELGAAHLAAGDVERATTTLAGAVERAGAAGSEAGVGAAANLLGLALLAADRPDAAVEAFRRSAGANPRRVRPAGYAVAKANLALAWRRAGDPDRAGLAAGQALATPTLPDAAREVALEACGGAEPSPGALTAVMAEEAESEWAALARQEMNRWLDLGEGGREQEARAWLDGVASRPDRAPQLLAAWFGALLELPTASMASLLGSVLAALATRNDAAQEVFRRWSSRATVTFAVPQLVRLHDMLEQLGEEAGVGGPWR